MWFECANEAVKGAKATKKCLSKYYVLLYHVCAYVCVYCGNDDVWLHGRVYVQKRSYM